MYHLAQMNVARMLGVSIEDSMVKEFVDNLNRINQLLETSLGLMWRSKYE